MTVSAYHHAALRVADIERSARFYIDALGGRYATRPMLYEGQEAEVIMGGTPHVRFQVCHIAFDDDSMIELFQFLEPVEPTGATPPARGGVIHSAFQVDDVPATLARVEAAGGARFWPEVQSLPIDCQVIYVTDPDGHVLELADISCQELVRRLIELDPSIAPPA